MNKISAFSGLPGFSSTPNLTSQEEIDKYFKEQTLKNRERLSVLPEPQYDYISIFENQGIDREEIPSFMRAIFKLRSISSEEKDIFIENFCFNYLLDEEFKNKMNGRYIIVDNQTKELSIVKNFPEKTPRFFTRIGYERISNGYLGKVICDLRHRTTNRTITSKIINFL